VSRNRSAAGESRLALVRRARRIDRILAETYPDAHCELDYSSPLEFWSPRSFQRSVRIKE